MDKKNILRNIQSVVIAIFIALLIRAFLVQAFNIPSGSMEPALLPGDYVLVNKFIYGMRMPYSKVKFFSYKKPQRGDIIVFIYPKDQSKDFIKRVIGVEGETVQIIQGKVYIDSKPIPDPWAYLSNKEPPDFINILENFGPAVVPANSVFVMGDNRNDSEDSRFWGFLPLDNVLGKAFIIYFSWNRNAENLLDKIRWSRIGDPVH